MMPSLHGLHFSLALERGSLALPEYPHPDASSINRPYLAPQVFYEGSYQTPIDPSSNSPDIHGPCEKPSSISVCVPSYPGK